MKGAKGFTLAELMVASLLFAMVIAGLATIYATLFKQTGGVMAENMLKNQATVAMRALKQELGQATTLSIPARGASSNHIAGCRNLLADGTIVESSALALAYKESASTGFGWGCFHFCVRPTQLAGSQCLTGSQTPPPCLYYYRPESGSTEWRNPPNSPPGPTVNDTTCGTKIPNTGTGITPQLIASNLSLPTGVANYFNRTGTGAEEGNVVRTAFVLRKDNAPGQMRVKPYEVDSTTQLNMGVE